MRRLGLVRGSALEERNRNTRYFCTVRLLCGLSLILSPQMGDTGYWDTVKDALVNVFSAKKTFFPRRKPVYNYANAGKGWCHAENVAQDGDEEKANDERKR